MLAPTLVEEVRRMLQEGHVSQRKIAQRTGVSRGTVQAIAQGTRPDRFRSTDRRESDQGFIPPEGRPARCPGCGAMVQMPCLLCYLRANRPTQRRSRPNPARQPNRETIAATGRG